MIVIWAVPEPLVDLAALPDGGAVSNAPRSTSASIDADVHDLVLDLEPVLEAAQLRDAHVERRLAALEPGRDRAAGPGLLALGPAAGRLALAGCDPAADAALVRPRRTQSCSFMPSPAGADRFLVACARSLTHVSALARCSAPPRPNSPERRLRLRQLFHGHEEADLANHAAGRGVVGDDVRAADALQTERTERGAVAGDVADLALDLGDLELSGHWPPPSRAPAGRRSGWSGGRRGGRSAPRRSGAPGGP